MEEVSLLSFLHDISKTLGERFEDCSREYSEGLFNKEIGE